MKSERVVSNPENHGWEEVNGKWIWASGRNTGHIVDGDTEGQIATWHDPANAWTPSNHVVVDSGTGNATFSGHVGINESSPTRSLHVKGASDQIARFVREGSNTARVSVESDAGVSSFTRKSYGTVIETESGDSLTINSSGDATFSGRATVNTANTDAYLAVTSQSNNSWNYIRGTSKNASGTSRSWRCGYTPVSDTLKFVFASSIDSDTGLTIDATGNATFSGHVCSDTGRFLRPSNNSGIVISSAGLYPDNGTGSLGADGTMDLGGPSDRFKDAYFSGTVDAGGFTVNGSPLTRVSDLIETLATLRASTLDETVDVRQALASACDKLIEKFESMQEVATRFEQADNEEEM